MSLRNYFDAELRATIAFTILGIIIGYISFLINSAAISFILMLIVGVGFVMIFKRVAKITKEWKWWFSNGVIVYIFMWLITWTVFYNIVIR